MINFPRLRSRKASCQLLGQNQFLFKEQQQKLVKSTVKLYSKVLTIQQKQQPFNKYKVEFDYDTIFSILKKQDSEEEQKTHGGVSYGIKFQKFQQQTEILNFQQPFIVDEWKNILGKYLKQRNFHQIFKPIKKIGQGNFASVYLVSKNQDKQLYAVKAFSKQLEYEDERGKECIQNQIEIMKNVNSKYLMKLQGVYETENSIYFVVEYLSGGLLYDKIKKRHSFTTEQIIQIMDSLLRGIAELHEKRIMHRDLKPENILFRDQDSYECVIADFGLATYVDVEQFLFSRCGTPGYVAPEISNLKDRDQRYQAICDMFSLGVIFHIILLGQSPFPGLTSDQVLKQNRQCKIQFQKDVYKKINPIWLDLLKRMLQKDPKKRITAAQALQHEFFTQSQMSILEELPQNKYQECDSPLMMTRNQNRRRNLRLRDDSCLKFKMRQNIAYNNDEEQHIQKINSPLKKRIGRQRGDRVSKTSVPSNFRQ